MKPVPERVTDSKSLESPVLPFPAPVVESQAPVEPAESVDEPTGTATPSAALDDRSPVATRPRRRQIPPSLDRPRRVLPEAFSEEEPPTSPTRDAVTASDVDAGRTSTIEASAAPRTDPEDERLDFGDLETKQANEDEN